MVELLQKLRVHIPVPEDCGTVGDDSRARWGRRGVVRVLWNAGALQAFWDDVSGQLDQLVQGAEVAAPLNVQGVRRDLRGVPQEHL